MAKPFTQWVLRHTVSQAAAWHRQGETLQISVNVSATNLEEEHFALQLLGEMAHMGLPRASLEVELTESALVSQGRRGD